MPLCIVRLSASSCPDKINFASTNFYSRNSDPGGDYIYDILRPIQAIDMPKLICSSHLICIMCSVLIQFNSVPWPIGSSSGHEGRKHWCILFQSLLWEAIMCRSGMSRSLTFLALSIQHVFCRPRRHPPSKLPWRSFWVSVRGGV